MNIITFGRGNFFPGVILNDELNIQIGNQIYLLDKNNPNEDLKRAMNTQATLKQLQALENTDVEETLTKIDPYFDFMVYDIPVEDDDPSNLLVLANPKEVKPNKPTYVSTGSNEVLCKGRIEKDSSFSEVALCRVKPFNSVAMEMHMHSIGHILLTWCGNGEVTLNAGSNFRESDFINGHIAKQRQNDKRILSELCKLAEKYC